MKKKNTTNCPTCSLLEEERASERKRREERGESEDKSYGSVDMDDVLVDLAKYAEKKKAKDIEGTIDSVLFDKLTAPIDDNPFVLDDLRRNIETLSNLVMNNIGDREKILKEINAHVEMISEYRRDSMGLTEEEASIQEDDDEKDDPTVH